MNRPHDKCGDSFQIHFDFAGGQWSTSGLPSRNRRVRTSSPAPNIFERYVYNE